jgi:hypothetical protein
MSTGSDPASSPEQVRTKKVEQNIRTWLKKRFWQLFIQEINENCVL